MRVFTRFCAILRVFIFLCKFLQIFASFCKFFSYKSTVRVPTITCRGLLPGTSIVRGRGTVCCTYVVKLVSYQGTVKWYHSTGTVDTTLYKYVPGTAWCIVPGIVPAGMWYLRDGTVLSILTTSIRS